MRTNYDIKLGVSLYSYQDHYYFKRLDAEGCIAAAAGAGAGSLLTLAALTGGQQQEADQGRHSQDPECFAVHLVILLILCICSDHAR